MNKKKFLVVMMVCAILACSGCGSDPDGFIKGQGNVPEQTAVEEKKEDTVQTEEASNSDEEKYTTEEESTVMEVTYDDNPELRVSYAEDDTVKAEQEKYMKKLHSVKGQSLMLRIDRMDGESMVTFIEYINNTEKGIMTRNAYFFFNDEYEYEHAVMMHSDEISEKNDDILMYIIRGTEDEAQGIPGYYEAEEEKYLSEKHVRAFSYVN